MVSVVPLLTVMSLVATYGLDAIDSVRLDVYMPLIFVSSGSVLSVTTIKHELGIQDYEKQ